MSALSHPAVCTSTLQAPPGYLTSSKVNKQSTSDYLQVKAMSLPGNAVYQKHKAQLRMVVHACDLSSWFVEMVESGVQDQTLLT